MEHFRVALRESRRSLGPLRQASLLGKHAVPPQFSQQLCTRARVSRSTIQTDAISRWQMRPRLFRLQRPSFQRYNSTAPEAPSLTARLRKLFREYGYTAVGVYAALLVLDLPFCYLAVKWLGAERIQHWEDVVVGGAKDILRIPFPNLFEDKNEDDAPSAITAEMDEADKEAEKGGLTLWTMLGLVFLVHKSFIFVRVPLTAALTPKVVKTLRARGWDIGKRKPKGKKPEGKTHIEQQK